MKLAGTIAKFLKEDWNWWLMKIKLFIHPWNKKLQDRVGTQLLWLKLISALAAGLLFLIKTSFKLQVGYYRSAL